MTLKRDLTRDRARAPLQVLPRAGFDSILHHRLLHDAQTGMDIGLQKAQAAAFGYRLQRMRHYFLSKVNHTFQFQMQPVNRDRCSSTQSKDENRFISSSVSQFSLPFFHWQMFFIYIHRFIFLSILVYGYSFVWPMYGRSRWGSGARGKAGTSACSFS